MKQTSSKPSIPAALESFDALPDSAGVRAPVVQGLFGIGRTTLWRWTQSGLLPKPVAHSERVVTWNVGELRKVLAYKAAA